MFSSNCANFIITLSFKEKYGEYFSIGNILLLPKIGIEGIISRAASLKVPKRDEYDDARRVKDFSEQKEKENFAFCFALWKSCFYLCIFKFPNNQLRMKKHLTSGQRYEISAYFQSGKSQKEIAEILSFNASTICCELKRNCDKRNGAYSPVLANRKYQDRMSRCRH